MMTTKETLQAISERLAKEITLCEDNVQHGKKNLIKDPERIDFFLDLKAMSMTLQLLKDCKSTVDNSEKSFSGFLSYYQVASGLRKRKEGFDIEDQILKYCQSRFASGTYQFFHSIVKDYNLS